MNKNKSTDPSEFFNYILRVGEIIEVLDFPEARKPAYKLQIDFGEFGIKWSSAQITKNYQKDNLKGKQVVAVTNFPPKRIAGFKSECLVLGAEDSEKGIILLIPSQKVTNGSRIS